MLAIWKLFANHEIKVLPSGDWAVAERLLLAAGRFHDVVANEIEQPADFEAGC